MRARHLPQLAAFALAAVYAGAATFLPTSGRPPTSYGGASPTLRALDVAAGLVLLGAGAVAFTQLRHRLLGLLTIAAGVAWFGPDWEGWQQGPEIVRSLGALAPAVFLALVVHVVAAAHGLTIRRGALVAADALAGVAVLGRALLYDPYLDLGCWRNCLGNTFLVSSRIELTRAVDVAWNSTLLALGLVVVAASWRSARLVGIAGGAWAVYGGVLLVQPTEDPQERLFQFVFAGVAIGTCTVATFVAARAFRALRTRSTLARLVDDLRRAPRAGRLEEALARALRDPSLTVAFPLPGRGPLIGPDGRAVQDGPDGRARTAIARGGETIAVVMHDPQLLEGAELADAIGAAARLAVDNERLRVEELTQLRALQGSRRRIVRRAAEARRRLERDLHDGAQQGLLALLFELREARNEAEGAGDAVTAAALADAQREAVAVLDELRRLAHGIYPAVLEDAGLAAALATLAEVAPLAVELETLPSRRYSPDVEATSYAVAVDAVADAAARSASCVRITFTELDDRLQLRVTDDGAGRAGPLVRVEDRVGALGGNVSFDLRRMSAELPCV